MSQAIRIALIVVAVASILALITPLVVHITDGLLEAFPMLNQYLNPLVPYLGFGRRMFNAFVGNSTIAYIVIVFIIGMPITYFFTSIVSRIYRLIVGQ